MSFRTNPQTIAGRVALIAVAALCSLTLLTSGGASQKSRPNRYIGASKCKSCHQSEESGNQYGAWMDAKHSKAFEVLASAEAKKLGSEFGISDPQKDDACLKCHITAFGEPKDVIKKGFKVEAGVQCESCHGPGEKHLKARFAAAAEADENEEAATYTVVPKGEIVTTPPMETCRKCHGEEAPNFERFCYYESIAKVRHLDPRKPRSAEDLAAMLVCGCGDCGCVTECSAECGVPPEKTK